MIGIDAFSNSVSSPYFIGWTGPFFSRRVVSSECARCLSRMFMIEANRCEPRTSRASAIACRQFGSSRDACSSELRLALSYSRHATCWISPSPRVPAARFLGQHLDDLVIVDQLDDGRDVLLVEIDAVPDCAKAHDLDLVHAALEHIERVRRMGTGDLRSKQRREHHERVVGVQFEHIEEVVEQLLHFGFGKPDPFWPR